MKNKSSFSFFITPGWKFQSCSQRRESLSKSPDYHLGLQTPPDGRPHVVDGNHHVSMHAHTQRENHLPLLDPVFSGDVRSRERAVISQHVIHSAYIGSQTDARWLASSSRTPVRWRRSWSLRWGCRRRVCSRCAACWSRAQGSRSGPWWSTAWNAGGWASPTPCCTRSLCTCMKREGWACFIHPMTSRPLDVFRAWMKVGPFNL